MEDSDRLPRKLAAILYADVAGYSRLTGEDEDATHRRLSDHLDLIASTVESHRGRVMHYAGDAVLAMFEAVVDALSCAAHIQRNLRMRNDELPDERKLQFRIGVNMGDVIEDRGDIYGEGVNIAARLEGLAEPGGICVSESVRTAIGKNLSLDYGFLGEQQVKNIAEPVKAYHVLLDQEAEASGSKPKPRPNRLVIVAALSTIAVVGGLLAWFKPWNPRVELASIEQMAFPLPNKPSIAVLPFVNMSGDPEQEYFADGIAEDLITDLSKISGLFVISRNSAFTYKGRVVKTRQVAEDLGVRYVLEGSVRRVGDQVRINAQLIDAVTGGHLWAERYDGTIADVFALQDNVSERIVKALAVELTPREAERVGRVGTDNVAAYDSFLKGQERYRRDTPEQYAKALEYFRRAVDLDPEYAQAYAAMGSVYWRSFRDEFYQVFRIDRIEARDRGQQLLERALRNPTAFAYRLASEVSLWRRNHGEAISSAEKAIALDPNDSAGRIALAQALIFSGRPKDAFEHIDDAERLDPFGRARQEYLRGLARFGMEEFDRAAASLVRARGLNPEKWASKAPLVAACFPCEALTATYGHLGRKQDAEVIIAYMRSYWPNLRIAGITYWWPFKKEKDLERLTAGLRKAGVPE